MTQAQNDRHYNTIQYGLRGMIMNGAMVAGVDDNSAIYYNPAALSISNNQGLDISLFAVSAVINNKKNLYNTATDDGSSSLSFIPGLITFNFRPFKNKDIAVSAGSFTMNNFRNKSTEQYIREIPEGISVNGIYYEHSVREYWLAGAVAYRFSNNVAIGLSQYLSLRNERYEHNLSYQIFDALEPGKLIHEESEDLQFSQSHTIGMISKLGLTWNNDRFTLGATITTPLYGRLFKSAEALYEKTWIDENGARAVNYSINNKGKEKSPFIARFGIEYRGDCFLIATSVEYFNRIGEFDLIRSSEEDIQPQINGPEGFSLQDSRKRIINLNLGLEVMIDDRFSYLGGLRTNRNYNERPADFTEARLHWSYFDIYHISNGLKVNVKRSNFTIGVDYAFSFDRNLPPLADLDAFSIQPFESNNSSVVYNNVTFLFTYNFILDKVDDLMNR